MEILSLPPTDLLVVDFESFVDEEAGAGVGNDTEHRWEDAVVHDARGAPTLPLQNVSKHFEQVLVPACK